MKRSTELRLLAEAVAACERCPRLRAHCALVARQKRRAYREEPYWGKPVPGFGDANARLLLVGLAPGAHGANRTGRMFTGDRSGDFLYEVLHATGFASQPTSTGRGDGLNLHDCYITAAARCAPPQNRPLPEELRNCRPWLARELALLTRVEVVVALGRIAFDSYLGLLRESGRLEGAARLSFAHGAEHPLGAGLPLLISSYHPSQQNTQTGRLTREMFLDVFIQIRKRWK